MFYVLRCFRVRRKSDLENNKNALAVTRQPVALHFAFSPCACCFTFFFVRLPSVRLDVDVDVYVGSVRVPSVRLWGPVGGPSQVACRGEVSRLSVCAYANALRGTESELAFVQARQAAGQNVH